VDSGVSAVEVENALVILFEGKQWTGTCELFSTNDPNLTNGNPIGDEKASSMMIIKGMK
jgi:hypothetical protein